MSHERTSWGEMSGQRKTPRTGEGETGRAAEDSNQRQGLDHGSRRLTQDVGDDRPGDVASEHGEERAQAADQQAELGERQRPGLAAPAPPPPLGRPRPATFTFPGFCCLNADVSSRRSLRESPGGGAGPDWLSRPGSTVSQLQKQQDQRQMSPRGRSSCTAGGGPA